MKAKFLAKFVRVVENLVGPDARLNLQQRDEMRRVVGELTDTLANAIHLAVIYLENSRYARNHELVEHLANARGSLNHHYQEFKICGAIYNLSDRLKEMYSNTKPGVARKGAEEIDHLLLLIAQGERNILDDLGNLLQWMSQKAQDLHQVGIDSPDWDGVRGDVLSEIGDRANELERQRDDLRRDVRHLLSKLETR